MNWWKEMFDYFKETMFPAMLVVTVVIVWFVSILTLMIWAITKYML